MALDTQGIGAICIDTDAFFTTHIPEIAASSTRHRVASQMRQQQLAKLDLALRDDALAFVSAEIEAGQMQWCVHQEQRRILASSKGMWTQLTVAKAARGAMNIGHPGLSLPLLGIVLVALARGDPRACGEHELIRRGLMEGETHHQWWRDKKRNTSTCYQALIAAQHRHEGEIVPLEAEQFDEGHPACGRHDPSFPDERRAGKQWLARAPPEPGAGIDGPGLVLVLGWQ